MSSYSIPLMLPLLGKLGTPVRHISVSLRASRFSACAGASHLPGAYHERCMWGMLISGATQLK